MTSGCQISARFSMRLTFICLRQTCAISLFFSVVPKWLKVEQLRFGLNLDNENQAVKRQPNRQHSAFLFYIVPKFIFNSEREMEISIHKCY